MRHQIIKSTIFFQALLSSYFQRMTQQIVETLVLLCVSYLFELYNLNQVADALKLPIDLRLVSKHERGNTDKPIRVIVWFWIGPHTEYERLLDER
ncbi:hypothetical protein F4054_23435 [Candidatus Poribacteria bacterium]|nr:hypothetical protein [Candidatus Poribacteria bacterium]MYG07297.1 hypothetical protein [Candidatus Poribacteria bacterium]MYK25206.1 hypothetical protein [Candidatus Poribacteria bacterium]